MEKIIRTVMISGEVYINREDVISLIQEFCVKGQSLSSKNDLKTLAESLSRGIQEHQVKKEGD